jgi:hypothetical protein
MNATFVDDPYMSSLHHSRRLQQRSAGCKQRAFLGIVDSWETPTAEMCLACTLLAGRQCLEWVHSLASTARTSNGARP